MQDKILEIERELARLNTDFKISTENHNRNLKNLEEKLQSIKELQDERSKTNRRWKPEEGEKYYTVTHFGEVEDYTWSNHEYDNFALDGYNCFQTREQAEQHLENIKTKNELRVLAKELNGDEIIDWKRPYIKVYYIFYDCANKRLDSSYCDRYQAQGVIYCLDKNFLDEAIEKIGEDRLIEMIKSGV